MFLIDAEGNKLGVTPTDDARRMAREAGLDLVEVAPNSRPPVCKILDYGKFKYEQKKKKQKAKGSTSQLKEMRVRPTIDGHDLQVKLKKVRQFLEEGSKVQITCLFRGRQMAFTGRGRELLLEIAKELGEVAKVERVPRMEGRRMNILLARK